MRVAIPTRIRQYSCAHLSSVETLDSNAAVILLPSLKRDICYFKRCSYPCGAHSGSCFMRPETFALASQDIAEPSFAL